MKTIIGGSVYNTETAVYIAWFFTGGTSYQDFNYIEQKLYQTKKWNFFLYICGGARTEYASHCGNSSSYGEKIEKMDIEKISAWIEKNSICLWNKDIENICSVIPFEVA